MTFLRVQARDGRQRAVRGQSETKVSSWASPGVAFWFLHDPLAILITVGSQWPWCFFSVWPFWQQPSVCLKPSSGSLSVRGKSASPGTLKIFFPYRKPVYGLYKQLSRLKISLNWFKTSWWGYSVTLTESSQLIMTYVQNHGHSLLMFWCRKKKKSVKGEQWKHVRRTGIFFPLFSALKSVFKSVLRSPSQRYIRNEFFNVSRETFLRSGDTSLVHLATGQYLPSDSIFFLKTCSISVKQAD